MDQAFVPFEIPRRCCHHHQHDIDPTKHHHHNNNNIVPPVSHHRLPRMPFGILSFGRRPHEKPFGKIHCNGIINFGFHTFIRITTTTTIIIIIIIAATSTTTVSRQHYSSKHNNDNQRSPQLPPSRTTTYRNPTRGIMPCINWNNCHVPKCFSLRKMSMVFIFKWSKKSMIE